MRKCPLHLYPHCVVLPQIEKMDERPEFFSPEWVKLYCAICIKAIYAQAKRSRYTVVNTL